MMYGKTTVVLCRDEHDLGRRAAADVAARMRELLASQAVVRMIFAGGESQITFFDALAAQPRIDWPRVMTFNMDEFACPGMPEQFTVGFQARRQVFDKVRPGRVCQIDPDAADPHAEALLYEQLLRGTGPIDILCQGIGTSGHLAFNEPGPTRFDDPRWVRTIDICEQSKRQLMADPNFMGFGRIPDLAITMTIPALMSARWKFTIVPLAVKRPIMTRLFAAPRPDESLPASIIAAHDGLLYIDRNSCPADLLGQFEPAKPKARPRRRGAR